MLLPNLVLLVALAPQAPPTEALPPEATALPEAAALPPEEPVSAMGIEATPLPPEEPVPAMGIEATPLPPEEPVPAMGIEATPLPPEAPAMGIEASELPPSPGTAFQENIEAGLKAFIRGRFSRARAAFAKAYAADPQSAAAAFYLGYAHYKVGEPQARMNAEKEKARDLFARAYTLDPAFQPVWGQKPAVPE